MSHELLGQIFIIFSCYENLYKCIGDKINKIINKITNNLLTILINK